MAEFKLAVGIDFGNCYSRVAVYKDGKVVIIPDSEGNEYIPSYVSFTEFGRFIGHKAKEQAEIDPANTVFGVKRLLGRRFDDDFEYSHMRCYPFKILKTEKGGIKIEVKERDEDKAYNPEEIAGMILYKLKTNAEAYLKTEVKHVVISVPSCFNDAQRCAIIDAATIADLEVLRLVSDTAASALSYVHGTTLKKYLVVFDMGGGSLSISTVRVDNDARRPHCCIHTVASFGDTDCGGEEFTGILVDHFIAQRERLLDESTYSEPQYLRELRDACVRLKHTFSSREDAIDEELFIKGNLHKFTMSRNGFETTCGKLITKIKNYALEASQQLTPSCINQILLCGSSSQIPLVTKILSDTFRGATIVQFPEFNTKVAVVSGAAILADELINKNRSIKISEVAPLTIRIKLNKWSNFRAMKKNDELPAKSKFVICKENTKLLEIYEGDKGRKNLLGEIDLDDAMFEKDLAKAIGNLEIAGALQKTAELQTKNPCGAMKQIKNDEFYDFEFHLDKNGILTASVREKMETGAINLMHLKIDRKRLSDEEIRKLSIKNSSFYREEKEAEACDTDEKNLDEHVHTLVVDVTQREEMPPKFQEALVDDYVWMPPKFEESVVDDYVWVSEESVERYEKFDDKDIFEPNDLKGMRRMNISYT